MLRPTVRSLVMATTAVLLASSQATGGGRKGGALGAVDAAGGVRAPLPRGKFGRATAEALGITSAQIQQQQQQQQQQRQQVGRRAAAAATAPTLVAASGAKGRGAGEGGRASALITPPIAQRQDEEAEAEFSVDAIAEAYDGTTEAEGTSAGGRSLNSVIDDPELAALVEAHKARHGSVRPPSPSSSPSPPVAWPAKHAPAPAALRAKATARAKKSAKISEAWKERADAYDAVEAHDVEGQEMESNFAVSSGRKAVADEEGDELFGVVEELSEADMDDDIGEAALAAFAKGKTRKPRPAVEDGDEEAVAVADVSTGRKKKGKAGAKKSGKPSSPVIPSAASRSEAPASDDAIDTSINAATPLLTNPFRGIHDCLARSYRLDQLLDTATVGDALFARQEKKSGAFSFLQFKGGKALYEGHWGSLADLQSMHQRQVFPGGFKDGSVADMLAKLRQGGIAVPGFSLFNNDLGLFNPKVTNSFPLLLAQRLLLFPDGLRHFHSLCGRENVPCDFFADVDLPDTTPEDAEKILLEIINYLEVRLPGVGFTDPFFLVLTNAERSAEKASYHIHARSMTYRMEEAEMTMGKHGATTTAAAAQKPKRTKKGGKATAKAASGTGEAVFDDMGLDEGEDDLTDLVNVVEAGGAGRQVKKAITVPKVIAFQDYRTVKLLADEVNQTIGKPVIDDNCYRAHGMLRCAFSSKLPSNQDHDRFLTSSASAAAASRRRLVPLTTASDSALRKKLSHMEAVLRGMTDPEILELTFCNRYLDDTETSRLVQHHIHESMPPRARMSTEEKQWRDEALRAAHKHKFKLLRPRHILGPQSAQALEYDAYGNVVSPFLTEAAKWRRYTQVVQKLRTLPPRAAEGYDVWVRIGLALHNFSNEDHVFEEWVRFSLKSPQKYSREVCRKKWVQFERNPDALNWRRGFNYLNSTVWRQV